MKYEIFERANKHFTCFNSLDDSRFGAAAGGADFQRDAMVRRFCPAKAGNVSRLRQSRMGNRRTRAGFETAFGRNRIELAKSARPGGSAAGNRNISARNYSGSFRESSHLKKCENRNKYSINFILYIRCKSVFYFNNFLKPDQSIPQAKQGEFWDFGYDRTFDTSRKVHKP
ncbi:MAG TPA: hypothetical protein VGB68_02310 [Pyrinomonadaceae bacterium]